MKIQLFSFTGFAIALACLGVTSCDTSNDPVPPAQLSYQTECAAVKSYDVSSLEAVEIAKLYANENCDGSDEILNRSVGRVTPLNDISNNPIAHIVNLDGGGWVIVSATKKYHPILAHSDEGSFALETATINPGLNMWLEEVDLSVRNSDKITAEEASLIELEWMEYDTRLRTFNPGLPTGNSPEAVACRARIKELNDTYYSEGWQFTTLKYANSTLVPQTIYATAEANGSPQEYTIVGILNKTESEKTDQLLTTRWDQDNGFNGMCPNNSEAGCVSVAMGQIMNYHKSPANFDWDNMSDTEPTHAVQYLLFEIGSTIGADYNNGGLSNIVRAQEGFKKFGYSVTRKPNNDADVHVEINSWKRPVYMRGTELGASVGHAWVCDGSDRTHRIVKVCAEFLCDGSYSNLGFSLYDPLVVDFKVKSHSFHMNWGWGGFNNGWFTSQLKSQTNSYFQVDAPYTEERQNLYVSVK